jgi:hypothetical protein
MGFERCEESVGIVRSQMLMRMDMVINLVRVSLFLLRFFNQEFSCQ